MDYRQRDSFSTHALLTIRNKSAIVQVLGPGAARTIADKIESVLENFKVSWQKAGANSYLLHARSDSESQSRTFEILERSLLGAIINVSGARIPLMIALTSTLNTSNPSPPLKNLKLLHQNDHTNIQIGLDPDSAAQFLIECEHCSEIMSMLEEGRLYLSMQPVSRTTDINIVGHHQALINTINEGIQNSISTSTIKLLEKSLIVKRLDHSVIHKSIESLLDDKSIRLSCNVSANSLTPDLAWLSIFESLKNDSEMAKRLTIGVSGSLGAPLGFLLLRDLKAVGCSISINGFGIGSFALDIIRTLRPAAIEISMRDTQAGAYSSDGFRHLSSLTALARTLAPDVIASGVASQAELFAIRRTAANWIQGDLVEKGKERRITSPLMLNAIGTAQQNFTGMPSRNPQLKSPGTFSRPTRPVSAMPDKPVLAQMDRKTN